LAFDSSGFHKFINLKCKIKENFLRGQMVKNFLGCKRRLACTNFVEKRQKNRPAFMHNTSDETCFLQKNKTILTM